MRKQTRLVVFDTEQTDELPPTVATDFIEWLTGKIESIPTEYRTKAEVEFGIRSGYEDDHYVNISIYYCRPETDDEIIARERQEQLKQDERKEWELRILASLKAKYES